MIKYCIFIIFGIILYLLLNTYNGFSIGIPNDTTGDEQQRAGGGESDAVLDCIAEEQMVQILTELADEGAFDSLLPLSQRYTPCTTNSLNRYDAIRLITLLSSLRNSLRVNTLSNDDLLFLGYNINQYQRIRHWRRYAIQIRDEFNTRFSSCASRKRERE